MPILDKLYTLKNAREQLEESAQVIQAKSRDDVGMIVAAWEEPRTPRQAAARPSVQRSDLESESQPPKLRSDHEPLDGCPASATIRRPATVPTVQVLPPHAGSNQEPVKQPPVQVPASRPGRIATRIRDESCQYLTNFTL